MMHKKYCLVSGVLFSLVAVVHLLRIIYGTSVQVNAYEVPMLVSWLGFALPAALASWAFTLGRGSGAA